jgi:hypothetical protein
MVLVSTWVQSSCSSIDRHVFQDIKENGFEEVRGAHVPCPWMHEIARWHRD